jgi:hypothetical protein
MRRQTLGILFGVVCVAGGALRLAATTGQAGPAPVPTFAKDVAPILYKNCTTCHRAGEIGPMPLVTYEDARPYAGDMRDQVMAGHMPPWHADPAFNGKFLNERRLSDADKQTIARWATGGAPRGDMKDMPKLPEFPTGWTIGTPDAVFPMPETFEVPANGTIEYQYFEVPTNFTEDKWVQAIEIRPGARAVVHHVLVYNREPAGPNTRPAALVPRADQGIPPTPAQAAQLAAAAAARGVPVPPGLAAPAGPPPTPPPASAGAVIKSKSMPQTGRLIATTAPGTNAMTFKPGTAMLIKAGAVLVFQVHYTVSGEPAKDRSSVGMVFAKAEPADEMRAAQFVNGRFVIPAGAADFKVDSEVGFSQDVRIWGMFPHTHLRGKRWEYTLVYPDGRTEKILSVPTYDFNWQTYYMFVEPLAVPKGAKILASAWYDNSTANKSNPDPKSDVRWGDQTWEEMQYTGLMYTVDSAHKTSAIEHRSSNIGARRPQ